MEIKMNDKYSLKIIRHGSAQQIRTFQSGAGVAGQAVVIQAIDAARFQLVNVVTLVSPAKLQLKRVGDALHLVLPGGDIEAPDLVIQDYFKVKGASLQGSSISGEWMNYDTESLTNNPVPSVVGAGTLSSSVVDKTSNVSLGGEGVLGTFTEHFWLWAGGIAGVTAASGGGSGGSTPTSDTSPLGVVQAYANGGSSTVPTTAQYTSIGLTLPTIAGLTAANVLGAMNAVVASKSSTDVATLAQLQTLANNMNAAYIKILAEANGATADATPSVDPTLADYASVGVIMGATAQTLALMNSALGEMVTTSVDSVGKLKSIATASVDVMKVAAGIAGATITNTDLLALGLTIDGTNSGINIVQAAALQANLVNLESSLGLAESLTTGAAVNTFTKVQALLSLQVMRSFNDDTAAIGSKSQAAPGVSDYTNIGIKSYASLNNTVDASRVNLSDANFSTVAGFSLKTTLNSALDKLSAGTSLTKTSIQSMVDSYYRILKEADGSTSINTDVYADATNDPSVAGSDPLAVDYANVGMTKVDGTALTVVSTANTEILVLLNDAVGRFSTTRVDTVEEISALEKAAENIFAIGAGTGNGLATVGVNYTTDAEWIEGLTSLGVTGVSNSNITAVKAAIDAKDTLNDGTAVDTVAKLQAIVSLARMIAFTNDGAAIGSKVANTPTLDDWGTLVNVNTSLFDTTLIDLGASTYWKSNPTNGVNALNSALDTYTGSSLTTGQLKTIADAYGRVLQEADNSRTNNTDVSKVDGSANTDLVVADLTNLGVTFLNTAGTVIPANTAATLAAEQHLLLDAIGGLASTAVDTVTELKALAKAADNVVKQAAGGTVNYLDSEWVSALSSLSITGANTNNIASIKLAITGTTTDGSAVDSYNELQSLVSLVRVNDYAALNTGYYTLPTIEDYQALVATNGTAADVTTYGLVAISSSNAGGAFVAYSNANSLYLSSYNDAVNFKQSNAFTTGAQVKSMVLAYNSILAEANGGTVDQTTYDPLSSDYQAVGVGTGTSIDSNITTMLGVAEYTALLTDVVANKTTTQVDQVSELNALASIIVKIQNLEGKTATGGANYTAITGGALQVSELASLGLDTSNLTNSAYSGSVLVNRLNNVYDNIIAVDHTSSVSRATLDSLAEMQALINNTSGIVI
jgi:hypothetical protein